MAWDKNRPVAPFTTFKEGTIFYERGEREQMDSFSYIVPTIEDIETLWECDGVTPRKCDLSGVEFRAFKNVELSLSYDGFDRGRSGITFYWRDEKNTRYPMFAAELDRLIKKGIISNKIGGLWSAEKRGQNYGIRLEKLLWRGAS